MIFDVVCFFLLNNTANKHKNFLDVYLISDDIPKQIYFQTFIRSKVVTYFINISNFQVTGIVS